MTRTTVAAVAANFGRDLDEAFARISAILADARSRGAQLVVLPEAALGATSPTWPARATSPYLPRSLSTAPR